MPQKQRTEKATKILYKMGLSDRLNHKPSELSGGEQQRVGIARSLANDPEIILADEPTGNLDSKSGESIMEEFVEVNRSFGKTVVIVTHARDVALYAKQNHSIIFFTSSKEISLSFQFFLHDYLVFFKSEFFIKFGSSGIFHRDIQQNITNIFCYTIQKHIHKL